MDRGNGSRRRASGPWEQSYWIQKQGEWTVGRRNSSGKVLEKKTRAWGEGVEGTRTGRGGGEEEGGAYVGAGGWEEGWRRGGRRGGGGLGHEV